jgi:hypothetical protein
MNWSIRNSLPLCLRVAVEGKASAEESIRMWDEILGCDNWAPGNCVLIDSTGLEPLGPSGNEITQAVTAHFVEKREQIGSACMAIFGAPPEVYQYSRQFQYGVALRGMTITVVNFAEEKEAIEWLKIVAKSRNE